MNTNEFYNKKGLEARKLRSDEIDEFAINLRLKWKDQEFTRIADRIWRSTFLKSILNLGSPQVGKLEDSERVLAVDEINKWCKRLQSKFSTQKIQEQYFSIFQPNPELAIPDWTPYSTYLPGELVQFVPEIDDKIWRLRDEYVMKDGQYFDKETNTVVQPADVKWQLYHSVKNPPIEQQPATQVAYDAYQPEVKELTSMPYCYWMCLKHIDAPKERIDLKRNLNETDEDFRIRVADQQRRDHNDVLEQKLEPRLDYLHMDPKWIPVSRKEKVGDRLKGRGWPGSEYWVCLHFPGTGQVIDEGNRRVLRISHKQVWFARAAFLGRIVKVHADMPKLLGKYNARRHSESDEIHLRRKVLNAFTEIDRYTNDLNDLGTVTIGRAMDTVASDMVNNAWPEKYQIFYRKDFQNVIERTDGISRTSDQDVWGKIEYITAGAQIKYGHGAVKAMQNVFSDQSMQDHSVYIRRVKPKVNQDSGQDEIESVSKHWDERALLWRQLFDYLHRPLIEYEKMHFEFMNSDNKELNKRLGVSGHFHELIGSIMRLNGGLEFGQVPKSSNSYFTLNKSASNAMATVNEAREFFQKGLVFFKMAYKEEKDFKAVNPIGIDTNDEDKRMLYTMLRYRPSGERGRTIRYILRCLYNGAAGRKSGAIHNIKSDGSQFFDWGLRIRKLFFKFTMFYGLLRKRNIIERNDEFEEIYVKWETIRVRRWDQQDIQISAYESIWEQGAPALLAATPSPGNRVGIWQLKIFNSDGPADGSWSAPALGGKNFVMKEYDGKGNTIVLKPYDPNDMPLLNKQRGTSSYYGKKYGERGEAVRWRELLEWYFIYMRRLDMAAIDPENWTEGTSVYSACGALREKHQRFLIAYLPEYRVAKDNLYGPLVFARLQDSDNDAYQGSILHVVAYCERLELNRKEGRLDTLEEDLTCMQWMVNGFNEDDNINVWLSGTKNILTQTITKNPINQYGPNALTAEQMAALKDIYTESGQQVRKDHLEAVTEYNELRMEQEKQEKALKESEDDEKKARKDLDKLEAEQQKLRAQLDQTTALINDIKQKAVQTNPVVGD